MLKSDPAPTMLPLSRVSSDAGDLRPVSSGLEARVAPFLPALTQNVWPAMVEALPAPVLLLEEQYRIVLANQAARQLLDAADSTFVGYSVGRFLSREKLEAARVILLGRPGHHSYHDNLLVGGVELDVKVSIELVDVDSREFFVVTLVDRSSESRERAEFGDSVRTTIPSELPVARIRQAQHFEVLGHLTGTLAHDFSNLLSVILGSLDAAKRRMDRGLDPSVDIERAIRAAERSVEATSGVLHYSRRRQLPERGVVPSDVLRELFGLLERALDQRGELVLDVEDCAAVAVEAAQLETAILNLVINSRDALGGDGCVTISCRSRLIKEGESAPLGLLPGEYVSIRVTDNGAGIPDEVKEHVFEPFFTTKPEGVGTGLGLSTVRAFARKSGGTAWLESRSGEGTTVELLLPVLC